MALVHLIRKPAWRATRPTRKLLSWHASRRLRISAALVAMAWILSTGPASADDEATAAPPAAAAPIDFLSDIQPIFVEHCYKCHGGDQRRGGLKLDVRDDAASGGDSGKPILGGTLETNELYHRVSSPDRTFRMPKNAAALSEQQIDRIRRWVQQQAPWPDTTRGKTSDSEITQWLEDWGSFADRYEGEFKYATPYGLAFIVAQLAILAVVRCGRAFQLTRPWAMGNARRFCGWCSQVKPRELALVWLLMGASLGLVVMRGHQHTLDRDIAKLRMQKLKAEDSWTYSIFGSPPKPFRLDEPKQISGTYYRGNCERNAQLFNNGNYLTAIFRISLCDEKHRPLELGDPEPTGGVYVRMELERAPGTAEGFFSKEMMGSVFLSKEYYHASSELLRDAPARLETLEEGKRWVCYFPVGPAEEAKGPLAGLIYVYTGRIEKGTARGDPQFAIVYDLHFQDGKLTDDADLWMNSFGNPVVAPPPQFNQIPFAEWFDYRPIPAITGPNSSDPKILGLEEYVKKGLIPPQPPAGSSPETAPPDDRPPVNEQDDSPAAPRPQGR